MPHLDGLPGADAPIRKRPKSSPVAKVASHLVNQLRRPTRLRRKAILTGLAIAGIISLVIGRRHADELQRAASTLSAYIPHSIAEAISHHEEAENVRWDDTKGAQNGTEASFKKPKFHLLIPTSDSHSTPNLCKTLLSAALLNYPPPTLLHYQATGIRPGADMVRSTFNFLLGKEAHDDDLVLIVQEDSWFQLPAEIIINRFFHGLGDSNELLLKKYGRINDRNETLNLSSYSPKYTQRVLFGAQKECSNPPEDPACYSIPQSTLPKDIYGSQTDHHPESKYNRPRFMSSTMVMGRVNDLRPIYKLASELLEFKDIGKHGSQHIFSIIFGQQEYARSLTIPAKSSWRTWFAKLRFNAESNLQSANTTFVQGKNYEFGIGLDYGSSIFQVMNNSAEDVRGVKFSDPSTIASSSKTPINLPLDLSLSAPPIPQHNATPTSPLDQLPSENVTWSDFEFATNIMVTGYSVPAVLSFHGNSSSNVVKPIWATMWYYPHMRALLRHSIHTASLPIPADQLWDLRGGQGGVWNEAGEWNSWSEICNGFSHSIFGDNKGIFGQERYDEGGDRPVYNQWGTLMSGKEIPLEGDEMYDGVDGEGRAGTKPGMRTKILWDSIMEEAARKVKPEENKVVNEGFDNVKAAIEKGRMFEEKKGKVAQEIGESEAAKAAVKLAEEALKKEEEEEDELRPLIVKVEEKGNLTAFTNGPGKADELPESSKAPPQIPGQFSQPKEAKLQPSQADTNNIFEASKPPSSNEPPILGKPMLAEGKGGKIELNEQQSQPSQTTSQEPSLAEDKGDHTELRKPLKQTQLPDKPILAEGKGGKIELNQQSQPAQSSSTNEPLLAEGKGGKIELNDQRIQPPQTSDLEEPLQAEGKGGRIELNDQQSQSPQDTSPKAPEKEETGEKEEKGKEPNNPPAKHPSFDQPVTSPKPPIDSTKEKMGNEQHGESSASQIPDTDLEGHRKEDKVEKEKKLHTSSKISASRVPGASEEYVDNDAEWSF